MAVLRTQRRGDLPIRQLRPDLPRPYRAWGYPVLPAVFVAGALYLIVNALVTDPFWTSLVFGITLAGWPVYRLFFAGARRARRRGSGRRRRRSTRR